MIYLRAAKKIYSKHKQNAGEEESYTHLLPQGWTLLLESTNGVHFNQGLQETTLNARLFSANGIDFTSQLRDITPLWSVTDSEWTATGWEVNLRKEDLPGVSIYASIVCKINFADVLRHFPFLPPVLVNIYQDKEIKGELSVYNPYSILTIIPDSFSVASVLAKDELFKVSVRGEKGDPGKSVTASEVVATLNTQQFRGTIKEALKADAAFVTATKGDKGERGLQGVQGVPGAKGADGKSVTASEVVATLNTQQFRGTIKDALKADAAFVTATKGDRGERGLQGVQGVPGAKGADGKSVTASEVVATLNTQQFRGTIKDALKADAAFVTATKGDRGERGLQGVQGIQGVKGDPGKSVTASEVVATLNTQQFRGTIKDALKADAAFVTATKGDKGERGLQGVQGIQGVKGDPGKSVTASEVVATLNTQQFRGTIKDALKADAAFVTATKGDKGERGERGLQGEKGDKPVISYAEGVLKVDGIGVHNFNQQFAEKANIVELNNYATTNALSKVETKAIRPANADSVGSSTNNPFAPILNDPNGEAKVISLNVVEGTDLYLPPARLCAVGTKIYLRGSTMSCPITPYHHSTTIRPIRIYSNERDVYSAGRYYSSSNLIETFTNAEWRVDLECIVAGCGLKGWLWVNSVESKNLSEFTSSITTAIQSIAEAKQEINRLKNNTLQKGGGLQLGFYNLVNHNSGTYHVQATDYHILARRTGNGDNYPYIRVSENLPNGHEFIVDIPFNDCRVRFVLPNGGSTWGNGGTEWQSGYRYHVTKSHTKEWGVIKTAYAQ